MTNTLLLIGILFLSSCNSYVQPFEKATEAAKTGDSICFDVLEPSHIKGRYCLERVK
jgi:hypothetical protein